MAQPESPVTVFEHCRVSPPTTFTPPPPPILTFFDFPWVIIPPVERAFFYPYHHDNIYFMDTTLPNLKHSLSLTLQHFYPLLGTLTWPSESTIPQIRFSNEENSCVSLTIAESIQDFDNLVGNHARDVDQFFPLVPHIPSPNTQLGAEVPVTAFQVTLFPNTGICIGISSLHVIGDGKTTSHFMKSWASVCRSGLSDTSCLLPESLPCYNKSSIEDPNDLETTYLNNLGMFNFSRQFFYIPPNRKVEPNKVRATFVLLRPEIQKLKGWVLDRFDEICHSKAAMTPSKHLSSFVLTVAFVWVCLVKVMKGDKDVTGTETEHLTFVVDCRERLNPPLPTTYFGNCLMACFADVKRDDLTGEDGIPIAAMAIGNAIEKMISEGVLVGAENVFPKYKIMLSEGWYLSLAGSPKLGVYDTDFGWGRPKKVEMISVDTSTGSMSLSEYPYAEGGLEVGLVLDKFQMDAFASLFKNTLTVVS